VPTVPLGFGTHSRSQAVTWPGFGATATTAPGGNAPTAFGPECTKSQVVASAPATSISGTTLRATPTPSIPVGSLEMTATPTLSMPAGSPQMLWSGLPIFGAAPTSSTMAPTICAVTVASHCEEVAERRKQQPLFNATVRRDIFAVLLNPSKPGASSTCTAAVCAVTAGRVPYAVSLVAKSSMAKGRPSPHAPDELDTFAFVDRSMTASLPDGWTALCDEALVGAVSHMGEPEPLPLAALKAFEAFLAQKATAWSVQSTSALSVEFLVAFARELTPRLDINFRIYTQKLSDAELATLSTPPFSAFVDSSVLRAFQDVPPMKVSMPAAPMALLHCSPTPLAAAPAALPAPAPSSPTVPDSPRLMPLPPLPPAAPLAPTAKALLFTKAGTS